MALSGVVSESLIFVQIRISSHPSFIWRPVVENPVKIS